jgi:RNA polymerase sigma-B factor
MRRDERMLARYAAHPSPQLRELLVRRYLPLARYCANQYARASEPFDDLVQVASVGLVKALDRYEPARGVAFSSYALPTMSGELRRHFRDHGWTVRPPRDLLEQALAVERTASELVVALGRAPTVAEIAERAGLTCEAVLEAREALAARSGVALSTPSRIDGDDHTLADVIGTDDDGFEVVERRALIQTLTRCLSRREREILRLRFEQDMTQREIGETVGLSQMHVSRILRDVLAKLRLAAAQMNDAATG